MKNILDWQNKEVVNIFDEVTLWSAPFGRLLLENIPMKSGATVMDIGFGTGFPLIELSQRFGDQSLIYGIDIWEEAINVVKNKIDTLELKNIKILEENASSINVEDGLFDLVTSNLGVNNFDKKEKVYSEIHRVLKQGGRLCITTNPIGTFHHFFEFFQSTLIEIKVEDKIEDFQEYINHRGTEEFIISEIEKSGFKNVKNISDTTNFRFVDAMALMNHSLIRIGFRESWEKLVGPSNVDKFFEVLINKINATIQRDGEIKLTIPMLYLEFTKE